MNSNKMKFNFNPFPILKSERLVLQKLDLTHSAALFSYQSNKLNFPYVDMTVYKVVEEAQNYISKMNDGVENNKWIIWAVCLKETYEIIGTLSIWNIDESHNKGEFGYGIFPEFRRKGYMKEAISCALNYAFENMKLDKVEAYTSHANKDSIAFLKAIEFEFIETIEDEYSGGALMDVFIIKNDKE